MIEFFQETINYVNLPATTLLVMVLLYWTMVMVGVFGMDTFDVDFDADVGGLDADLSLDADVGIDFEGIDTPTGTPMGTGGPTSSDGVMKQLFEFFHLGEVPVIIVSTFVILFFWIATLVSNHYFNQDQNLIPSLLFLIPNLVVTLLLTRVTMIPFAILFRKPPMEDKTRNELYGLIGEVTTTEVTETFGQIEVKRTNEPEMRFNVRTRPGQKLAKGDAAKIISYNHVEGTFLVELTKWETEVDS